MKKITMLLAFVLLVSACAAAAAEVGDPVGADDDGDQAITHPGDSGEIPQPRLPIPGNIDGAVFISTIDLRIMESFPIQVALQVDGDKPTPCHEVFWTVEDDGGVIDVTMITQSAVDQNCIQVLEPFSVSVPLGSWQGESRQVVVNGELVGSFDA